MTDDSPCPPSQSHSAGESHSSVTGSSSKFVTEQGTLPQQYVDIVIGGQAGSEGKGAIVAHLIRTGAYGATVRPGSSNAGHTVYDDTGDATVHQVIPSGATVDADIELYMAPESSFGLDEFFAEFSEMRDRWGTETAYKRMYIDPKAAIITDAHKQQEADNNLGDDIGSTAHGCGAVRVEKIWRSAGDVQLAEDYDDLSPFIPRVTDTDGNTTQMRVPKKLANHGRRGNPVIIEGTQGAFLSMNQGPHWPFSTSRDCTASAFLSSVGLPPSATRDTWAVFRTYPIRVGGTSGPMEGDEITFETIADRAGFEDPPVEYTSVTNKKRRIFEWSWSQFDKSLALNDPDKIALTFLDYLSVDNYGVTSWDNLTKDTRQWVTKVQTAATQFNGSNVALLKTGPKPEHIIDLRNHGFNEFS